MMKVKVYVGQDVAIKGGSNEYGIREAEVDVAKLSQIQRDMLAHYVIRNNSINVAAYSEEAVIAALDREIEEDARRVTEKKERYERFVQEFLDMPQDEFNQQSGYSLAGYTDGAGNDPRLAEKRAIREEYLMAKAAEEQAQREARERANEEAMERKLAEQNAKSEAIERQLTEWVAEKGTDNQKGRLELGLLPEDEIIDAIRDEVFAPIDVRREKYHKIQSSDVCECDYGDTCHVEFDSGELNEMSPEAYEGFTVIKELAPEGATLEPRYHSATAEYCGAERYYETVLIKVTVGVLDLSREYYL